MCGGNSNLYLTATVGSSTSVLHLQQHDVSTGEDNKQQTDCGCLGKLGKQLTSSAPLFLIVTVCFFAWYCMTAGHLTDRSCLFSVCSLTGVNTRRDTSQETGV